MAGGIERRAALGLIGATLASTSLIAQPKPRLGPSTLDLDASGRFRSYMLMRGALDDRLVIGFLSGRYFGVMDGEMKPLYGVASATFARYRHRADGGYDVVSAEQAYFTDLATGQWITRFRNPFTDETVDVPVTSSPATSFAIRPDLSIQFAKLLPGIEILEEFFPFSVNHGFLTVAQLTRSSATFPGSTKAFHYSELVEMRAKLSDLSLPAAVQVGAETSYTSVVSWRPWLKMGDRPGNLLGTGRGAYGATMDALPANWVAATRKHRPALLANPRSILGPD